MAGVVQPVVEQLKDDYSNVRQAASEAIPKLAEFGQSATFSLYTHLMPLKRTAKKLTTQCKQLLCCLRIRTGINAKLH